MAFRHGPASGGEVPMRSYARLPLSSDGYGQFEVYELYGTLQHRLLSLSLPIF